MKKFLQTSLYTLMITPVMLLSFQGVASAGLFDGAKDEACKGATVTASGDCEAGTAAGGIEKTIKDIINLISIIVGIVAVIMLIINGFRLVTSGGDSNTVSSARSGIIYALVGLIIVVLAQVIVKFVLTKAGA